MNQKALRKLHKRRKMRNRQKGTSERLRLSIFKSNKAIYLQLVDDQQGHTLAAADSRKFSGDKKAVIIQTAEQLVKEAKAQKIEKIVLDRGIYKYHGTVKLISEIVRKQGLQH